MYNWMFVFPFGVSIAPIQYIRYLAYISTGSPLAVSNYSVAQGRIVHFEVPIDFAYVFTVSSDYDRPFIIDVFRNVGPPLSIRSSDRYGILISQQIPIPSGTFGLLSVLRTDGVAAQN